MNGCRVRLLGPLEVAPPEGPPLDLRRPKERALLAALALDANHAVPADELADELWGGRQPRSAANTLQAHVAGIRRQLGPGARQLLATAGSGYLLAVDETSFDLRAFEDGVRRAREEVVAGRPERAADGLRRALALWRGRALEDVALEGRSQLAVLRLEELRIAATEELVAVELELGRHGELLPELEALVAAHPLHERFREQLMLALYRAGRQAEALELYRETRRLFVDEIGVEPGPALKQLQRAILDQHAALDPRGRAAPAHVRQRAVVVAQSVLDAPDEEDVERAAARLLEAADRVAAAYAAAGAQVETQSDGVVAIFGAGGAGEDDALRAAAAALEATAGAADVRSGVAAGRSVAGDPRALRLSAPARRALALARAAVPGEVLVDVAVRDTLGERAAATAAAGGFALTSVEAAPRPVSRSAFVGRRRELRRLLDAFGAGEALVVRGEPGIGKTRLAVEARAAARTPVLYARCRADADPYRPLRELVPGPDAGDALAESAAAFAALLPPGAVVLDDAQAAEPPLLELLPALSDALAARGSSLVVLTRPEAGEPLPGAAVLELERLDRDETAELLRRLRGRAPRALVDEVHRRSGGNPLFVEQLVATGDLAGIPPTLEALLAARLDRLPAVERRVVETAAVLGGEVTAELVERVGGGDASVLPALCDLWILEAAAPGGYRLAHQLLRDAAYEAIPRRERASLHEQAAEALDDGGAAVHLEAAAALLREAGDAAAAAGLERRAAARLEQAGRLAYASGDNAGAAGLLARARALLGTLSDPSLLVDLADTTRELGDFARAAEFLAEAEAAAGDDRALRARITTRRIRLDQFAAGSPFDEAALDACIAELEAAGDERALAEAWLVRATGPWRRCRARESEVAVLRALSHARRAGRLRRRGARRVEADCLTLWLGISVFGPLQVDVALRRAGDVAGLPQAAERVLPAAHRALGALLAMRGSFEEARAELALERELSERLGRRTAIGANAEIAAQLELLARRPDAAAELLAEALAKLDELREFSSRPTLYALDAEALRRCGRADEALAAAARAAETAAPDDVVTQVQWRAARARLAGDRGLAEEALALARATDFVNLRGDAQAALAATTTGAAAAEAREAALREYGRKGNAAAAALLERDR